MKKKIAIFTGSGVSAESGISTFRDIKDGLWYNYNVDDVATLDGWKRDREVVIEFRNMLKNKLSDYEPNGAHNMIAALEKDFDVSVITQNVDDLHERAGSTNVIHIHGELLKANSSVDRSITYDYPQDIKIGDKCEKGSQIKPNMVLFGEMPYKIEEAWSAIDLADYLIVIGTTFSIGYTREIFNCLKEGCKVFYIDPDPAELTKFKKIDIDIIKENAVSGVKKVIELIKKDFSFSDSRTESEIMYNISEDELIKRVEHEINLTPTGDKRNLLTDLNILLNHYRNEHKSKVLAVEMINRDSESLEKTKYDYEDMIEEYHKNGFGDMHPGNIEGYKTGLAYTHGYTVGHLELLKKINSLMKMSVVEIEDLIKENEKIAADNQKNMDELWSKVKNK